jgi:hypothetical protein
VPPGYPAVCHDTDCRLWQSHTMAKAGCGPKSMNCSFVEMQKDGNAVMYKGSGVGTPGPAIWFTGTKVMPTNTKNVLWMIADDMRPDMNLAYGQKHMLTPAFDRLAKEGSVRRVASQPTCQRCHPACVPPCLPPWSLLPLVASELTADCPLCFAGLHARLLPDRRVRPLAEQL